MIKIYTSKTIQIEDAIGVYTPVSETFFQYGGTVGLCKGDSTAQAAEKQQASFDSQLMSTFQQQFGQQSQIFNYLKGKLQPMIDNPTGLSDTGLAAARTSSDDQLSAAYQNAQKALNAKLATSGDSTLPSGVGAQLDSALLNSEAADKATSQNQITMQNEQLKQQNYWNAIGALSGQQAQLNPLGYASGATSGSGAVSSLSNAVTASSGPTFGSILGGVIGGVGSAAVGNGGALSKLFGCWIASRIWGSLDPRTLKVREYIHGRFAESWYGNIISKTYLKYGIWVSNQAVLVKLLTPAFNYALACATE